MSKSTHSIRTQAVEVEAESEALALALQTRMGDVNRRHLLPVIERVLDEFDVPGRHIRLDRLKVNLGRLRFAHFEEEAAERLYVELRKALAEVLREPGDRSRTEGAARMELLEYYLLRGTLPFWAPRAAASSPESFFLKLTDVEPEGVAALVRRFGRQRRVLERLVLCFGETFLRRLLHLLEPVHAALILAYMLDLREVHRVEPLLPLGDRPFTRLVWLLVLSYLVEEPGSQFNRKSFVKSLLEGMAASEGLSYAEIIRTLRLGLRKTMHRHPIKSSLPGVIDQLMRDLDLKGAASASTADEPGAAASREALAGTTITPANIEALRDGVSHADAEDALRCDEALARLERYLTVGEVTVGERVVGEMTVGERAAGEMAEERVPQVAGTEQGPARRETAARLRDANLRDAFRLLAERDASRAGSLLRRLARGTAPGSSAVIGRLLSAFTPKELLAVLLPEHGQDLLKLVELLREVSAGRRAAGTLALPEDAMWREALAAILQESSWRPGLSASVRSAFEVAATYCGVSPVQLAEELERAPGPDAAGTGTDAALEARELLARTSRTARARAPQEATGTASPELPRATELTRTVFVRYDLSEALCYYLDHGVLPWNALLREPALTAERVVAHLLVLTRTVLRRLLVRDNPEEQLRVVSRAVENLPDEGFSKLLLRLLRQTESEGAATLLSALPVFAPAGGGRHDFHARVIAAILDDRSIDLEELSIAGPLPPAAEFILLANPFEWEPHLLKSAVVNRLRFGEAASVGGHTHEELLDALLSQHPGEARHFLRAVGSVQGMRAAFVRECPAPLLDHGLELLHPDWAESLRALAHSVTHIAAPYRTLSEEDARRVIFDEALRARAGEPLTAPFFLRVLRRLFQVPLAERVSEVLLREAGAWAARGNLPAEHAAAFESAVRTAAAVAQARDMGRNGNEERRDAEESAADFARASVFAFLLGVVTVPSKGEASRRGPASPRQEPLKLDAILHELERMIEESPSEVYDFISQHLTDAHTRERWLRLLPESTLVRLSYLLEPRKHRALLDAAEVLDAAWAAAVPLSHPSPYGRGVLWSFLFEYFTRSAGPNRTTEQFVAAFFEHYAARYLAVAPGATDRALVGANMLERAADFARDAGHAMLHALLRRERVQLLAPWQSSAAAAHTPVPNAKAAARHAAQEEEAAQRPAPRRGRTAFSMMEDKEEGAGESIYIANAGLVLTGPFLPAFFQSLDLLGQDERGAPRLRDRWCASRAVHLLQYLVDGRTDTPEPLLVLNKILCGLSTSTPVEREIDRTADERVACERLLTSVIANWKIIERTSIAGLQETFLRREGRLEHSDSGWRLTVQRKTLDVLVDQIPWSVSVIYQRWMPRPLYVTW
ncbi:MAG TPA: contractile injection system tape measure protein [Pyrinomonadaceae bacterium]